MFRPLMGSVVIVVFFVLLKYSLELTTVEEQIVAAIKAKLEHIGAYI